MPTNDLFVGMSINEFIKLVRSSVKEEIERLLKGISEPHSDELMNLQETANFLQVSKVTVHKWKKNKLIKSY